MPTIRPITVVTIATYIPLESSPRSTVMGLIVGIPAYFGYNYLVARIEKLVFQMEANSIAFMDILNQPVQK